MKRKILIAEDNEINRQILRKILLNDYDVIEARNGQEALDILKESHEQISAMLLDINMPVMNGFEVLERINIDERLSQIPVIVTTINNNDYSEVKALSIGANDYIVKPYNPSVIIHRLHNTIRLRETSSIVNSVKKDTLTGVYNKLFFYRACENQLISCPTENYDIICCDIERFKLFNELFGEKSGDNLLKCLVALFTKILGETSICGRIGADTFACMIPHNPTYDNKTFESISEQINQLPFSINIDISYGIYSNIDRTLLVSTMCDRALTACNSIKGKYGIYYAYYDNDFREKLLSEQFILDSMKKGISEKQFEVYYQPKNNLITNKVIGAEALVRWNHPTKGFLSPNDFIPLFERNGFITDLDIYVWNKACEDISNWINSGNQPLSVSVNVSRADLYNPDLPDILTNLIKTYNLKPEYLHLEITESAYTQDSRQIINTVSLLKDLGFVIEMDDFGTGYSSLNMLSDLPINIIKLDMVFIRKIDDERKMSILKTIIYLAKQLELAVVAEGVETQTQLDILRSIDCDYAQGYYYSKPLPREDFEKYLLNIMNEI